MSSSYSKHHHRHHTTIPNETYAIQNSNGLANHDEVAFKTLLTRIFENYNHSYRVSIVVDFFKSIVPQDAEWYYVACSSLHIKTTSLKNYLSDQLKIGDGDIDFEVRAEVMGKVQQYITFRKRAIFPERYHDPNAQPLTPPKSNRNCCRRVGRSVPIFVRLLFYLMLIIISFSIIKTLI